jgi:Cdc6-like AAA superfamily ATPase
VSLVEVAGRRLFGSVTDREQLARLYVASDQLVGAVGDARPEARLMQTLAAHSSPRRVQVVGGSGAGKTSMILKVLGDLERREVNRPHEVLIVDVGDDPARLETPAAFMRMVVQLIQLQGYRFATVDQDALRAAAADERTRTGTQFEHRGGVATAAVSYQASLRHAYESEKFGDNPARAKHDFADVLGTVAKEYRPVVVIDDTEHFVAASSGQVDVLSVTNLYDNGLRALAEIETLDLVVAVHPHYERVAAVRDVATRYRFERVEVPSLAAARPDAGLAAILQRRLDHGGVEGSVRNLVEADALAQMEALYFFNGHDLREVLDLAADAAAAAVADGEQAVTRRHVQVLLDRSA